MLRLFLVLLALMIPRAEAAAQTATDGARFSFKETVHDFGRLKADTTVTYRFEFANEGNLMLIINDITLSCPCFETDWVRGPVMPGEKGWVLVRYPTGPKPGPFDKLLWITSNAVNNSANLDRFELRITGLVEPAKAANKPDSACDGGVRLKKTGKQRREK